MIKYLCGKNSGKNVLLHWYRLKSTGELAGEIKCPQSRIKVIVLDYIFTTIERDDDRIEINLDEKDYTLNWISL